MQIVRECLLLLSIFMYSLRFHLVNINLAAEKPGRAAWLLLDFICCMFLLTKQGFSSASKRKRRAGQNALVCISGWEKADVVIVSGYCYIYMCVFNILSEEFLIDKRILLVARTDLFLQHLFSVLEIHS